VEFTDGAHAAVSAADASHSAHLSVAFVFFVSVLVSLVYSV
jgi:hypothetical protein